MILLASSREGKLTPWITGNNNNNSNNNKQALRTHARKPDKTDSHCRRRHHGGKSHWPKEPPDPPAPARLVRRCRCRCCGYRLRPSRRRRRRHRGSRGHPLCRVEDVVGKSVKNETKIRESASSPGNPSTTRRYKCTIAGVRTRERERRKLPQGKRHAGIIDYCPPCKICLTERERESCEISGIRKRVESQQKDHTPEQTTAIPSRTRGCRN